MTIKRLFREWWVLLLFILMLIIAMVQLAVFGESIEEKTDRITAAIEEQNERNKKNLYKELHYFKDPRTGLCFAGWIRGTAALVTHVPCEALDKLEESK